MKIFCVGMNYAQHNRELGTLVPDLDATSNKAGASDVASVLPGTADAPTLFLKPDTALSRPDWPFFIPDWSQEVEYETELVVRINHLGKSIPERFAHRYYDEVTLGIDFTARDVQRQLAAKGQPWELAKGFDGAAYCGQTWLKLADLGRPAQDLHFSMQLNGETRQEGWTGHMLHTIDQIIAYASRFYLLKTGDLIFTGTPAGVGRVKEGDLITAQLEGQQVLEVRCK